MGSSHLNKEKSTFDFESKHEAKLLMGSSFAIYISNCHKEGYWVDVEGVDAGNDDQRDEKPSDEPQKVGIVLFWEYLGLGFAQEDEGEVHLEKNTEWEFAHEHGSSKGPPDLEVEYGFLKSVGKWIGRNDS